MPKNSLRGVADSDSTFGLQHDRFAEMNVLRIALYRKRFRTLREAVRSLAELSTQAPSKLIDLRMRIADEPSGQALQDWREEYCLRQHLFSAFYRDVSNSVLINILAGRPGRIHAPISRRWRRVLGQQGVRTHALLCATRLWMLSAREMAAGLSFWMRAIGQQRAFSIAPTIPYAVLVNTISAAKFVPRARRLERNTADCLSWYWGWSGRNPDVGLVWLHTQADGNAPEEWSQYVTWPLPLLKPATAKARFAIRGLKRVALAVLSLLIGRWHAGILLRDRLMRDYVELLPQHALAREYVFDLADRIRRPLWTYTAEDRGSRVIMLNYSVNDIFFTAKDGPNLNYNAFTRVMTWSDYVAMSRDQGNMYKEKTAISARLEIVEIIDRNDDGLPTSLKSKKNQVLVFDIVPYHYVRFVEHGSIFPYFYGPNACRFLDDVVSVAGEIEAKVILKGKKDMGKFEDKGYRRLKNQFAERGSLSFLSPTSAASRAMAIADVVISMPFTSTAIIAKAMGKSSIYYDPTRELAENCPELHGVKVVGGRSALRSWMTEALQAQTKEGLRQ